MYQRDTISKIQTVGHYRTNGLVSSVSNLKLKKKRDRAGNVYIKINLRYIEPNAILWTSFKCRVNKKR